MRFLVPLLLGLIFSNSTLADRYLGLPALTIPLDNPQTAEKTALGRMLFHEQRLSADGSVSCASCHRDDMAFTDGLPVAIGIGTQTGTRNTPTILNAAYYASQFLDGRENSLESQSLGPLLNPVEHGMKNYRSVVDAVRQDADYIRQFNHVFNVQAHEINIDHIAKAIASFERTLIAGNSAFDRYYFGKDRSAISESAARGSRVFMRKGNCMTCHEISWNHALFTDNRFYNVGVGFTRLYPVINTLIDAVTRGESADTVAMTASQRSELGRFNVTRQLADVGKFKTPTLRNIALTAPYMHDGSLKTLEEVVEHYDKGGKETPYVDAKIFPLHLTTQEKADLVAFMKSLTSSDLDDLR